MTLTNYSFVEWLKGWWPTIKEVLKFGLPLFVTYQTTHVWWQVGFGTILGKFLLDLAHYWLKTDSSNGNPVQTPQTPQTA